MYAVRWIQADALAVGLGWVIHHFINVGRAEVLAGAAEFLHAARVANIRIVNHQMRRLIFFMLRAGVIQISQLIESQLAVALRRAEILRFFCAARVGVAQLLHVLITGR